MLPPCPRLTVPPGCPTSVGLIVMLLPSSCSPPFITAADACPAVIALSPASWSHSWLLLPSLLTPVPLLHFVFFRAVFLLVYDIFFYSPPWGLSLPQTFILLCWLHLLGLGWRTFDSRLSQGGLETWRTVWTDLFYLPPLTVKSHYLEVKQVLKQLLIKFHKTEAIISFLHSFFCVYLRYGRCSFRTHLLADSCVPEGSCPWGLLVRSSKAVLS